MLIKGVFRCWRRQAISKRDVDVKFWCENDPIAIKRTEQTFIYYPTASSGLCYNEDKQL